MKHSFNIEVAQKVGMAGAVILDNLYYWIEKNKANEKHFHDGYYWTYNSIKAFEKLFPYLTSRKISNALKTLEQEGYIITGNYNKIPYDRTKWYAITLEGYSILQNCTIEEEEKENGNEEIVEPIPYNKPDYNQTNNKPDNKKERKKQSKYDEMILTYTDNLEVRDAIYEFIKMRKLIKKPLTDRALKILLNKLDKLSNNNDIMKVDILNQSIVNSWQSIYELKTEQPKNNKYESKSMQNLRELWEEAKREEEANEQNGTGANFNDPF